VPPWERLKPFVVLGATGVGALVWVLAFETSSNSSDWGSEWSPQGDLRGKSVAIKVRDVETTAEREKRQALKNRELRDDIGSVKKSLLGDKHHTRGDDIQPENPELPPGFEYNPRDACLQMKLEYPERYGEVDCMSDKYDSPEVWWKVGPHGQ
jgi:hypothetical protein